MTRKQLQKFCDIRNASEFASNLQFQIDLEEAGLSLEVIGQAYRVWDENGQVNGYRWDTPVGVLREGPNGRTWVE